MADIAVAATARADAVRTTAIATIVATRQDMLGALLSIPLDHLSRTDP